MTNWQPTSFEQHIRTEKRRVTGLERALGASRRPNAAATVDRPDARSVPVGYQLFDTTLGKPIWSAGDRWVDAGGATV